MKRAIDQGYAICQACGSLTDKPGEDCQLCGASTATRKPRSLQSVWAYWIAGVIAYIPANVYPIMVTDSFQGTSASTIIGSVFALIHHGSYP
ncbi:MAG: paraquat-inducible protein A, partial [Pseudomonadota bacterium]